MILESFSCISCHICGIIHITNLFLCKAGTVKERMFSMLQIKNIYKQYQTGSLIQKALDGVSLNLRDNEFVAIHWDRAAPVKRRF